MISRKQSKRKSTSGVYHASRKKRLSELARPATLTKLGSLKRKSIRVRGGISKQRVLEIESVNLFDGSKCVQAKIKTVVENSANRNFIRRNIITKGTIVDTEKGKARITSRPGQEGSVNAVLIK